MKEHQWRAARSQPGAARHAHGAHGAALLLALALALGALSGALLGAPAASAAAQAALASTPTSTATTAAATNTLAATPAATATTGPTATATATTAPTPTATTDPNHPYNLDITAAAAEAGWPQSNSNWCGVATIAAIADYLYPGAGVTQPGVFGVLNTNDPKIVSEWGSPPQGGYGPYIPTDIAQDFGTDPRSIAEGLTIVTGRQYHVIVDTAGAYDTTLHIVRDILTSHQPVSVFVDHGEHSVLVSGVDTANNANPLTDPGSITAIYVWDPGQQSNWSAIQPQMEMAVPISQWLSGTITWSGAQYFKYPYSNNMWNGAPLDPDPAIGPYAYVPGNYNHMWVGNWVYISPLGGAATYNLNADWELTPGGALYSGFATSQFPAIPAGYTGPTVQMPTNPPPPPPPVQPPKIAPPLPPPPPAPTATPIPTATLRPRDTPAPYITPAATIMPDPPAPCSDPGCALRALAVKPGPLAAGAVLLVLLGLALTSPFTLPRLIALRAAGAGDAPATGDATSDALDAPTTPDAPLLPPAIAEEETGEETATEPGAANPDAASGEETSPRPAVSTTPIAEEPAAPSVEDTADTVADGGAPGASMSDPEPPAPGPSPDKEG